MADVPWWAWLIGLLIYLPVCGSCGAYVAHLKRRSIEEGFWLGVLLGPFGVVTVACLSDGPAADQLDEPELSRAPDVGPSKSRPRPDPPRPGEWQGL